MLGKGAKGEQRQLGTTFKYEKAVLMCLPQQKNQDRRKSDEQRNPSNKTDARNSNNQAKNNRPAQQRMAAKRQKNPRKTPKDLRFRNNLPGRPQDTSRDA